MSGPGGAAGSGPPPALSRDYELAGKVGGGAGCAGGGSRDGLPSPAAGGGWGSPPGPGETGRGPGGSRGPPASPAAAIAPRKRLLAREGEGEGGGSPS